MSSTSSQRRPEGRPSQPSGHDEKSYSSATNRYRFNDDLESRQSWSSQTRRRASEGEDALLSELAAPPPVEEHQTGRGREGVERGPSEEEGLRRASENNDNGDDAFLSELAAPPPVEEQDRNQGQSRRSASCNEDAEEPPAVPSSNPEDSKPSSDQYSPTDPEKQHSGNPNPRPSSFATHLYTVSYLVFFSILGTLARMGLQRFTRYRGAPVVFSLVWPNFGGSLFMGFLSEDLMLFREEWGDSAKPLSPDSSPETAQAAKKAHGSVKKTIPLFIGLATGFCGSFTSFSGFMRDAFLAMSNNLAAPIYHPTSDPTLQGSIISRDGGYSFLALLAVLLTTVCLSLSALSIGAHLALFLSPVTPTLPFRVLRRFIDPLMVILSFGCWLGAVFMAIFPPDRFYNHPDVWRGNAVFPIVFAPLGCLFRFYASVHLNGRIPSFPLGTFSVNVLGTMIEGMAYDLQHSTITSAGSGAGASFHDVVSCQVLQGINDGFCGCMTTVSTWVAELKGLRRRHAYVYGIASVGVAFSALVIEMGSFTWTDGLGEIVCQTAN